MSRSEKSFAEPEYTCLDDIFGQYPLTQALFREWLLDKDLDRHFTQDIGQVPVACSWGVAKWFFAHYGIGIWFDLRDGYAANTPHTTFPVSRTMGDRMMSDLVRRSCAMMNGWMRKKIMHGRVPDQSLSTKVSRDPLQVVARRFAERGLSSQTNDTQGIRHVSARPRQAQSRGDTF